MFKNVCPPSGLKEIAFYFLCGCVYLHKKTNQGLTETKCAKQSAVSEI